jgi:SAM-dependent methyltransferase
MTDMMTAPRPGSATMQGDLWGPRARDYAELQEGHFRPLYESVLRRPEITGAETSLDVGCGPGLAAQVFTQKIANVSGIGASAAFIAIARQRLPGRDFSVGEMEALPHADASFDVVTGFNAFQYAASPRNALVEAGRVLRPKGTVVIATWGLPQDCEAAGRLKASGGLTPPPPGAPVPRALGRSQPKGIGGRGGFHAGRRCGRGVPLDLSRSGDCAARHALRRPRRTRNP